MRDLVPFRDINVHASASHYAFTSPSSPSAQTLVVERPAGDLRLNDGALLGTKRVSSIAGILGMIKLKLGKLLLIGDSPASILMFDRQIHRGDYQGTAYGSLEGSYGLQNYCYRIFASPRAWTS